MPSRLVPRLILLVSVLGLATTVYVVSGFSRTQASRAVSGFSRTTTSTQTHAPSNTPDDGVWEAATRAATTSGSGSRIRTQDVRAASFGYDGAPVTGRVACARSLPDIVHDCSRQQSLPLLI